MPQKPTTSAPARPAPGSLLHLIDRYTHAVQSFGPELSNPSTKRAFDQLVGRALAMEAALQPFAKFGRGLALNDDGLASAACEDVALITDSLAGTSVTHADFRAAAAVAQVGLLDVHELLVAAFALWYERERSDADGHITDGEAAALDPAQLGEAGGALFAELLHEVLRNLRPRDLGAEEKERTRLRDRAAFNQTAASAAYREARSLSLEPATRAKAVQAQTTAARCAKKALECLEQLA